MLKNYLKVALRSMRKHPSTTAINVVGLMSRGFLKLVGLVLLIALATVSSQALRAATADPVRSLRAD